MARTGKVDRAWSLTRGSEAFTVQSNGTTNVAEIVQVVGFSDIHGDEQTLQEEKSEWYLERVLLWYRLSYFSADGGLDKSDTPMFFRLGTGQISNLGGPPTYLQISTEADGWDEYTQWARVLHDDIWWVWQSRQQFYNNNSLLVDTGVTANARGFHSIQVPKMADLTPRCRLFEDVDLLIAYGAAIPENVVDGETYACQWWSKCLWRHSRS